MNYLVIICGPTGVGKTRVSLEVAEALNAEIISADSRQIFKEMLIGTAVPSKSELQRIPHHFIQSHSIHDNYNASKYEEEVIEFLQEYYKNNQKALLVGGSGMYIDAVCKGIDELPSIAPEIRQKWLKEYENKGLEYLQQQVRLTDPDYYKNVDRQNHKRLLKALEVYTTTGKPYSSFLSKSKKQRNFTPIYTGINMEREKLYQQINLRVDEMVEKGLLREAEALQKDKDLTPLKTVGYREFFEYLEGKVSSEEAVQKIKNHSRAYARRQLTWFRRYPEIKWFEPEQISEILAYIEEKMN